VAQNPALRVRVSTENGHHTVTAVAAERAGSRWRVLKQDAVDRDGRPLPPKPRVDVEDAPKPRKKRAPKPRDDNAAATPTPEPETVSGDTPKE
jgi:hypothetical protein